MSADNQPLGIRDRLEHQEHELACRTMRLVRLRYRGPVAADVPTRTPLFRAKNRNWSIYDTHPLPHHDVSLICRTKPSGRFS